MRMFNVLARVKLYPDVNIDKFISSDVSRVYLFFDSWTEFFFVWNPPSVYLCRYLTFIRKIVFSFVINIYKLK